MPSTLRFHFVLIASFAFVLMGASPLIVELVPDPYEPSGTIDVGKGFAISSIQLAIDLAREGSTIVVHEGDYRESISLKKGLRITSPPGERSNIFAVAPRTDMMNITSDSEAIVENLVFNVPGANWSVAAIKVQNGIKHIIRNNTIMGGWQGIWVHGGDADIDLGVQQVEVYNNTISNVTGHGIYMQRTYGNVWGNRINTSGDGIMVAFGWTEPNEQGGGNISGNWIDNCSVGVNIVNSSVFTYTDNHLTDCGMGEMLNSTAQTSAGNHFTRCTVGTHVLNGSRPRLIGNDYSDGGTPVLIENCTGARLLANEFISGSPFAVDIVWSGPGHLQHTIAKNNTVNGDPIFYSFGDSKTSQVLDGYGQVIIANSTGSSYRIADVGSCVTSILCSKGIDISGSNISKGLRVVDSDVSGDGVVLDRLGPSTSTLDLRNSSADLLNSTMIGDGEGGIVLDGSTLDLYSTIADETEMSVDPYSQVRYHAYLGISAYYEDVSDPVKGGEYLVTVDGKTVRSTAAYGGPDRTTGADGSAGPFWLLHRSAIASSSFKSHPIVFTVKVIADRTWEQTRDLLDLSDHQEVFITPDIRAPATPANVQIATVDDGIGITWTENRDDTVLYNVYRLSGTDWSLWDNATGSSYTDPTIKVGEIASFRITAVDDVGLESGPSAEVEGVSKDDVPPLAPTSLQLEGSTDDSVSLSWGRSPSLDVVLYELFLVEVGSDKVVTAKEMVGSTANTSMTIYRSFDEEDLLSVRAVDESDKRSILYSPAVRVIPSDPTWPVITKVEWTFGARRASISFTTDVPTKGDLFFGTSTASVEAQGLDELGTEHVFEMDGLLPNTRYYFYIYAVEPSGNSVTDDNKGMFYTFLTYGSECYLTVTLLDEDGEPVAGADVRAQMDDETIKAVETSPGTYYALLLPGNWTVTAISTDHKAVDPRSVELGPGQYVNLTFELESIGWAQATVTVVVLDEEDVPVVGAVVEIDGTRYTTGDDGRATSGPLTTNTTHSIRIKAKGYGTYEGDLFVSSKKKEQITTLRLSPAPEGSPFPWWIVLAVVVIVLIIVVLLIVFFVTRISKDWEPKREAAEGSGDKVEEPSPRDEKAVTAGKLEDGSPKAEEKKEE